MIKRINICACGCARSVKAGNRYILGHNRRKESDIKNIYRLYVKKGLSPFEISQKLSYSVNLIKRCIRQCNVTLRNRSQSAALASQKGKFYMQTEKGKREHGKKMKGHSHNRIFKYNRSIFKSITKQTAYLLGYICADGCISKDGKLMFATKDKILLEKINRVFQSNKSIKKYGNGKYFRLEFCSHEIKDSLLKLRIIPKKPLRAYPSNLSKKFYPDFVRGYFDGDGCFAYHVTYDIYKSMITSCNYKILEWINNILPTQQGTIYKRTSTCYELRYGFADTLKLGNFIYKDLKQSDIYLPRKFILFKKIKKFANTKRFKKIHLLKRG